MLNKNLIIILGAPGSGKGTQTNKLLENKNISAICMGDIVRNEISNKTEFALTMQSYLDKGDLVPDSLICDLFTRVYKKKESYTHLILDGFPRTLFQCKHLESVVQNEFISKKILLIDVPNEILVQRLLERKRSDDTKSVIENRLKTFEKEIKPILNYFTNHIIEVNGNNEIDSIYKDIINKIK
tara:strand:- start:382 stop:933 length:552 start_codon:yes stop_codon:yes gene_type:complete